MAVQHTELQNLPLQFPTPTTKYRGNDFFTLFDNMLNQYTGITY